MKQKNIDRDHFILIYQKKKNHFRLNKIKKLIVK